VADGAVICISPTWQVLHGLHWVSAVGLHLVDAYWPWAHVLHATQTLPRLYVPSGHDDAHSELLSDNKPLQLVHADGPAPAQFAQLMSQALHICTSAYLPAPQLSMQLPWARFSEPTQAVHCVLVAPVHLAQVP